MNTVPKPYRTAEESEDAFKNYSDGVEGRNHNNVKFGKPEKAEENTEQKPEQGNDAHQKFVQSITLPSGGHPADAAKGPNGETITWSGKSGDPWIDLVTGKPVK
jgi:hypothetical protein